MLDARIVLEPGVARMAAARATPEDIGAMADDLDAIERGLGDHRTFSPAYRQYWDHLARSTHNAFLAFLSPALRAIVNSAGFVPNELYRAETLVRLRGVHAAIADHDEDGAAAAMTELELEFLDRLSTGYPRQVARVVAWSDLDLEDRSDGHDDPGA